MVVVYLENLLHCVLPREDKGDREGIPHAHPIP